MNITKTIKRSLMKRAIKRALKRQVLSPLPLIGIGAIAVLAIGAIRKKGALRGSADAALDLIPVVGVAKNVVEIFTGDLIPGKKA
jgi:hypothetical protein